nr:MAG: RNA-dependent RNA-polymerase [Picobirnavirus sp.]
MDFKIIPNDVMQKALRHKYTRKQEETLVENYGCKKPDAVPDGVLQVLRSRKPHGCTSNQGLFRANAYAVVDACFGNPNTQSTASHLFDTPYASKVGGQGASFPTSYLVKVALLEYYDKHKTDFVSKSGMSERDVTLLRKRLTEVVQFVKRDLAERLCPEGKFITPLSKVDAAMYVCRKDTQAYPLGGQKNDPHVLEYLLNHPEETGGSVLLGQRYQRNKTNSSGEPLPRCVFNSDVRDVAEDARYTVPLIRAMQADAQRDYMSPFMELLGPEKVGAAQATWYDGCGNKPMPYWSIMGDVTAEDQCISRYHGELFLDVVEPLFAPESRAALRQSVMHCFEDRLLIDEEHELVGEHSIFSGVDWTHLIEEVISYIECLLFVGTTTLKVPSFKDGIKVSSKWVDCEKWKPALIQVCGDDVHILLATPDSAEWCFDTQASTPEQHFVYCAAVLRLDANVEKQAVWRTKTSFCSKFYSPAVRVTLDDGSPAFKPIYSPVLAINGVLNPEDELSDPSITKQLSRACQILDQSYGHEKWNQAVTLLTHSIAKEDADKIRTLLEMDMTQLDSRNAGRFGGYYTMGAPEWFAEKSPTVALMLKILGMSTAEVATWRKTLSDVHMMRRLHWLYRVNPDYVATDVWYEDKDVYRLFFDDSLPADDPNSAVSKLTRYRTCDPQGTESVMRVEAEYASNLTFDQNMASDTPMSTYRQGLKNVTKALNYVDRPESGSSRPTKRF